MVQYLYGRGMAYLRAGARLCLSSFKLITSLAASPFTLSLSLLSPSASLFLSSLNFHLGAVAVAVPFESPSYRSDSVHAIRSSTIELDITGETYWSYLLELLHIGGPSAWALSSSDPCLALPVVVIKFMAYYGQARTHQPSWQCTTVEVRSNSPQRITSLCNVAAIAVLLYANANKGGGGWNNDSATDRQSISDLGNAGEICNVLWDNSPMSNILQDWSPRLLSAGWVRKAREDNVWQASHFKAASQINCSIAIGAIIWNLFNTPDANYLKIEISSNQAHSQLCFCSYFFSFSTSLQLSA